MFRALRNLFAPEMAPEGPVTFDFEIDIKAPPEAVYPLIDFADSRYAKKQLGHTVRQIGTDPDKYSLILTPMPEFEHICTITRAEPPHVYALRSVAVPQAGVLQWSQEQYTLEPYGNNGTLLTLLVEAQFDEPLTMREYSQHIAMMAAGCSTAIKKIKLHAEQGAEAVREMEAAQFQ
ncbi:MAG: SRPBCC family protein [Sphingomonadaceae bacterium]|nr:MAG: SRPBCC family protein [Sphingomonadaceae bacterium]